MIKINKTLFRTAATAAILAGLAGTAAYAVTDTAFLYSPPRPGFLTINPMSFAQDGFDVDIPFSISWNGGTLSVGGDATSACFNTHVSLPAGAKLTGIRFWTTSPDQSGLFTNFVALNLSTGVTTPIFSGTVGTTSTSRVATFNAIPAATPVINNTNAYGLGVCVGSGESFGGARIEYTAANAGD